MKKIITILGLLTITSTLSAREIICQLAVWEAADTSVWPGENIILKSEFQRDGQFSNSKCKDTVINNVTYNLCTGESEIAGGYFAVFNVASSGIDEPINGYANFATLRNGKGTIKISEAKAIHNDLRLAAGVYNGVLRKKAEGSGQPVEQFEIGYEHKGDSQELDYLVPKLINEKLLDVKAPLVYYIESCNF